MYETILALFLTAFNIVETTSVAYMTFEVLSVCCCVFLAVVPFLITWLIIRFIFNLVR